MNKTFHQRRIQTDDYSYITNLNLVLATFQIPAVSSQTQV